MAIIVSYKKSILNVFCDEKYNSFTVKKFIPNNEKKINFQTHLS